MAKRFKVTVECSGVPPELGEAASRLVADEFTHRPWHTNPEGTWADGLLKLSVFNDYDSDGSSTLDEFSDALSACLPPFDGAIRVSDVSPLFDGEH